MKLLMSSKLGCSSICEPRHDKTNKLSVRPAKKKISLGIRPVWSESSLCAKWVDKGPRFLHADSEDSDQTGRMPRLIWVFAGRTVTLLVLSCRGSYYEGEGLVTVTLAPSGRVGKRQPATCGQTHDPRHDKTNKMSVRPAKTDQPGHPPMLIRVLAVRMMKVSTLSYPLSAQRRLWSD